MRNPKPPSSSTSHKHYSSSSARRSRWESTDGVSTPPEAKAHRPLNPKDLENKDSSSSLPPAFAAAGSGGPSPFPAPRGRAEAAPFHAPTPQSYGFQNLERRTIVLVDGSVRSYFALPRDYPEFESFSPDRFREQQLRDFGPPRDSGAVGDFGPPRGHWLDGPRGPPESGPSSMKRKHAAEEDEFAWHRQHISQYGNPNPYLNPNMDHSPMRRRHGDDPRASKQVKLEGEDGHGDDLPDRRGRGAEDLGPVVLDVDPLALKAAYLKFAKIINENTNNYLDDGKNGSLQCIVCGRFDFICLFIMICIAAF